MNRYKVYNKFAYRPSTRQIMIGMQKYKTDKLTEDEMIKYVCDAITHEFMHYLIHKQTGSNLISLLFDTVEYHFRDDELHHKMLSSSLGQMTHKDFIDKFGFEMWLMLYHRTKEGVRRQLMIFEG